MKSRGVYIILGLVLGGIGAHNFYVGRYEDGAQNLAFSAIALLLLWLHPPTAAFMIAVCLFVIARELYAVKTDASGNLLRM
jgi:TM2 domain-containing membrane protein YozV